MRRINDDAVLGSHHNQFTILDHANINISGPPIPHPCSADLLEDRELRDLIAKVDLSVDADIEAGFPSRRAAQISIETTQGETLEHYAPTRKGDPDNPLTDDELTDKFLEITNPVLGEDGAAAYLDQLWRLDETDDLCALPLTPTKANAAQ